MELRQEAFHLLRQLFQQHTAQWQHALPELTKPQYAVMRSIAENPGIEQVALTEVAVSTKATLAEMLSRMEARGPGQARARSGRQTPSVCLSDCRRRGPA